MRNMYLTADLHCILITLPSSWMCWPLFSLVTVGEAESFSSSLLSSLDCSVNEQLHTHTHTHTIQYMQSRHFDPQCVLCRRCKGIRL
ncbi:hypothetical protein FKM82_000703 [Ascaphus truei]